MGCSAYQPHYAAYAHAHGRTPDAMLEHDTGRWPGGRMAGFIVWISERWAEWDRMRSRPEPLHRTPEDRAAFRAWLDERFPCRCVVEVSLCA